MAFPKFSADSNRGTDAPFVDFPIEANIRCRPFSHEKGPRIHRVRVEKDGTLLVWDDVARHFTRCHIISERAARRIAAKAYRAIRG